MATVDDALRRSSEMKARRLELMEARREAAATCHVIEAVHERSEYVAPDYPLIAH